MGLFDNVQRFYTLSVCNLTARDGKFQRDVYEAVRRFKEEDWGEISEADKEGNKAVHYVREHCLAQLKPILK